MSKNQIKTHVAKVLFALGSLSTVAESCSKTAFMPLSSSNFAADQKYGDSLLPVGVYLPEGYNIDGIIRFAQDVVNKPGFKNSFYKNPELVLKQYGIESYDPSSPQIQIILASADPEVMKMIEKHDFRGYLHVLEEKNYLQTETVQKFISIMDSTDPNTKSQMEAELGCVLTIPIALAIAVVVAVEVAWVAAVWAHVVAKVDLAVQAYSIAEMSMLKENAITLYLDQSRKLGTLDISEDKYISAIREAFSDGNITNDEEDANKLFQYGCGAAKHLIEELQNKETNE